MVKSQEIPKAIKNPRNAVKVAKVRMDSYFGKIIFKNTAGLKNNLRGKKSRKEIEKIKKEGKIVVKNNLKSEELEKNGHAFLGYVYDESLIENISSEFKKIIEDDNFSFVRSQHNGEIFSRQIRLAQKQIPEIKKLITPEIIELFEQYYKTPIKIIDVYAWRNYYVPPEISENHEMFSSYWHCDGRDTTWTKLFVYMSDVTEDDGPFTVQTIERTKELMKIGFVNRKDPGISKEVLENPNYITKYTGKKGATIAANLTLSLHKAGIPEPKHQRDIIQFQIAPASEPLREDWEKDLEGIRDYNEHLEDNNSTNKSIT